MTATPAIPTAKPTKLVKPTATKPVGLLTADERKELDLLHGINRPLADNPGLLALKETLKKASQG